MEENVELFCEKVVSNSESVENLSALEQFNLKQVAAFYKGSELNFVLEDFIQAVAPLSNTQIEAVSGGWNPWGPIFPSNTK